jgi:hypothetical protein
MKQSFVSFLRKQQVVPFLLDAFGVTSGLVVKVSGIDTMKPCTCRRQAIIASTVLIGVVIIGRRGYPFTHESSVYKIHVGSNSITGWIVVALTGFFLIF